MVIPRLNELGTADISYNTLMTKELALKLFDREALRIQWIFEFLTAKIEAHKSMQATRRLNRFESTNAATDAADHSDPPKTNPYTGKQTASNQSHTINMVSRVTLTSLVAGVHKKDGLGRIPYFKLKACTPVKFAKQIDQFIKRNRIKVTPAMIILMLYDRKQKNRLRMIHMQMVKLHQHFKRLGATHSVGAINGVIQLWTVRIL